MPDTLFTDNELVAAMKRDDQKAFRLIFHRYWKLIYKKAFSYLHDAAACEELVNDIFQSIWQNRQRSDILNLKNYLTAATRYRVYSHLHATRNNPIVYVESYNDIEPVSEDGYAPVAIRIRDLNRQLENTLNEMPGRCREMFLLSRKEHLTNEEIAQRLGISQRTVENQISNALKYLRLKLGQVFMILIFLLIFMNAAISK
jgi:RNA polymerase sigma-70 factor (ECF subfamily)